MRDIKLLFMGPIKRPRDLRGPESTISVGEDCRVVDLLTRLGYDEEERARLRVIVGGRTLNPTEELGSLEEEVTVFLPLGGG